MPIRPNLRQFYGKTWREETRPRILLRAENKCEECGVPNHAKVIRAAGWWTHPQPQSLLRFMYGKRPAGQLDQAFYWTCAAMLKANEAPRLTVFPREICRQVTIRLGVAHLNHTAGDDRDENLKALCQWCHLEHDKEHHHETRGARKDATRPLLNL